LFAGLFSIITTNIGFSSFAADSILPFSFIHVTHFPAISADFGQFIAMPLDFFFCYRQTYHNMNFAK